MANQSARWLQQPQVGIVTFAIAASVLATAWSRHASLTDASTAAMTLCLIAAVVLGYKFPIYIRHNTKLSVSSIPLFLFAALLPPPLACTAALIAIALGGLAVRKQRGSYFSDIATHAGRGSIIVLMGSVVAHVSLSSGDQLVRMLPYIGAAIVLWAGDLLTLPLALTPICGERPGRILVTAAREGGLSEAAQYVVGVMGVLLAMQQIWALLLLVVPTGLIYLACKKEMDADTFQLLESMADSVDLRNPYAAGHSRRVADLVNGILCEFGMQGQEARHIQTAARLHDIGKIGLPDELLMKTDNLSDEEQRVARTCPDQAVELLRPYPDLSRCIEMIRHQHERWDGAGYPEKRGGTDIRSVRG